MSTRPLLLIAILMLIAILNLNLNEESIEKSIEHQNDNPIKKVILIPLDSRPPNKEFVIDLAEVANVEVIVPEHQLLDYFTVPSEVGDLRKWLIENSSRADAIILSIDQILNGGLIASRENDLTIEQIDSLEKFLINLHSFTDKPIYAFSILPRLQPQQSIDNFQQRRALIAYSRMRGMIHKQKQVDDEMMFEALMQINEENLNTYLKHFEMSKILNERLIKLTEKNILNRLVIGVDDGEEYSIQNEIIDQLNISNERVNLIHGADEIAMTLIAEMFSINKRICIRYCDDEVHSLIMPYMSVQIEEVIDEKIKQLKLIEVDNPNEADFTLYIYVNDKIDRNKQIRSCNDIRRLIESGNEVALVDLSKHFNKEETLMPMLMERAVPINLLIAYAGWNTTSNAIGTAISEAILSQDRFKNLIFLNQRILEDYIYLKDGIDIVNQALKLNGSYDTSYLDYGVEYEFASEVMKLTMTKKITDYKNSSAFKKEIKIEGQLISLKDIEVEMNYKWPRTFEINLRVNRIIYNGRQT